MKRGVILSIVVILLLGMIFGYYQPKIRSYEIQVANLTTEVANLKQMVFYREQTISSLEQNVSNLRQTVSVSEQTISSLERTVSGQKITISTLEAERSKLQTDLSSSQAQTQTYKGQVTTLTSQLSSLQERLSKIFNSNLTQYYGWIYQGRTWQWELPIPLSLYVEYLERPRPQSSDYWVDMAKDPKDNSYIDQLIQQINSSTLAGGFTEAQKLNFVIAFVQSLPYTVDKETTPFDEYPRYPIETLFDKGGDCEDTSILVAALLDRLGYDVALLFLKDARHVAVGVSIPSGYGTYYEYKNQKYYYLETTGDGWEIGEIPSTIVNRSAYIYPLRS